MNFSTLRVDIFEIPLTDQNEAKAKLDAFLVGGPGLSIKQRGKLLDKEVQKAVEQLQQEEQEIGILTKKVSKAKSALETVDQKIQTLSSHTGHAAEIQQLREKKQEVSQVYRSSMEDLKTVRTQWEGTQGNLQTLEKTLHLTQLTIKPYYKLKSIKSLEQFNSILRKDLTY